MVRKFEKEQVEQTIRGSFGIVSTIAKRLGCEWHTAQKAVNRWAETRQAYADEDSRSLDLSESKMLELINEKDGPMIRYHLSTKGKGRGYVQKQEMNLTVKREKEIVEEIERELAELAAECAAADVGVFENETQPEGAVDTPDEGTG